MSPYKNTLDADGPHDLKDAKEKYIDEFRKYLDRYRSEEQSGDHRWMEKYGDKLDEFQRHLVRTYGLTWAEVREIEQEYSETAP